jgi:hypothetical protein
MLGMLNSFPLSPAGPASEITGGLTAEAASRGLAVPAPLSRAYQGMAREGELKSSADKAFVATLGFLAGAAAGLGWGGLAALWGGGPPTPCPPRPCPPTALTLSAPSGGSRNEQATSSAWAGPRRSWWRS